MGKPHAGTSQRVGPPEVEAARLTIGSIQLAYRDLDADVGLAESTVRLIWAALPDMNERVNRAVDEGVRIGAVVSCYRWLSKKFRS